MLSVWVKGCITERVIANSHLFIVTLLGYLVKKTVWYLILFSSPSIYEMLFEENSKYQDISLKCGVLFEGWSQQKITDFSWVWLKTVALKLCFLFLFFLSSFFFVLTVRKHYIPRATRSTVYTNDSDFPLVLSLYGYEIAKLRRTEVWILEGRGEKKETEGEKIPPLQVKRRDKRERASEQNPHPLWLRN